MTIAALFNNPITLGESTELWLILPLCVAVAIIYKTIRTNDIRRLWLQVVKLVGLMFGGLVALGLVLWLIQSYWP